MCGKPEDALERLFIPAFIVGMAAKLRVLLLASALGDLLQHSNAISRRRNCGVPYFDARQKYTNIPVPALIISANSTARDPGLRETLMLQGGGQAIHIRLL